MADSIKTGVSINFSIPLVSADDNATVRSLTIDTDDASLSPALLSRATLFANQIETTYPALLQPTNWRDDDDAETAWSIAGGSGAIDVKLTYKQEVLLDRSGGGQ